MKSLKNAPSYTQISVDTIMGIKRQPENTCPIIDSLIYDGRNRTKIYATKVSDDPSHLMVETISLINTIEELEVWASEVVDIYSDLDISELDEDTIEDFKYYVNKITEFLNSNQNNEIENLGKKINSIVDEWEKMYSSYENCLSDISSKEAEIRELENELNDLDSEEDENEYENLSSNLEDAHKDLENLNEFLEGLEKSFRYDIEIPFDNAAGDFTELLENVRKVNDNLRQSTKDLKKAIIDNFPDKFDLTQPMAFLKTFESSDDEISIGVMKDEKNAYPYRNFANYLKNKEVINDIQEKLFISAKSTADVIDLLHGIGYSKVYYYDTVNDFIRDRDNFKVSFDIKGNLENKIETKKSNTIKLGI